MVKQDVDELVRMIDEDQLLFLEDRLFQLNAQMDFLKHEQAYMKDRIKKFKAVLKLRGK